MFGVPLVTLVTSEGTDVPKIVRRIVEHVEQFGKDRPRHPLNLSISHPIQFCAGMREEGLYRVNGSTKTIEKLKASFNTGTAIYRPFTVCEAF